MNRIKICAVLLGLITAGSVLSLIFMKNETERIIDILSETEQLVQAGEREKAMEMAKYLESRWEDYQSFASIFVRNEKISNVQTSMVRLYYMIEADSEELGGEFANTRSGLEWIVESEIPVISNIL